MDWDNDGIYDETGITGSVTHDFGVPGTYTISIRGHFPRIYFNFEGDKDKILRIDQWGSIPWSSMNRAFAGCTHLNSTAADVPALFNVTDVSEMFSGALNFNQDISYWDMSNVLNMSGMFFNAQRFDQTLGEWRMPNVVEMDSMLSNTGLSCRNYGATLVNWSFNFLTPNNIKLGAEGLFYDESIANDRETLLNKGWVITGDEERSCFTSNSSERRTSISLYPNPTRDIIRLNGDQPLSFRILDGFGRVVKQGKSQAVIRVNELPPAMYYLHILDEDGQIQEVKKIVKN